MCVLEDSTLGVDRTETRHKTQDTGQAEEDTSGHETQGVEEEATKFRENRRSLRRGRTMTMTVTILHTGLWENFWFIGVTISDVSEFVTI